MSSNRLCKRATRNCTSLTSPPASLCIASCIPYAVTSVDGLSMLQSYYSMVQPMSCSVTEPATSAYLAVFFAAETGSPFRHSNSKCAASPTAAAAAGSAPRPPA